MFLSVNADFRFYHKLKKTIRSPRMTISTPILKGTLYVRYQYLEIKYSE